MNENTYKLPSETACDPAWAALCLRVLLVGCALAGAAMVVRVACGAG